MRILFVAPNILIPGNHGGSTHVTEVVRELRRDHRVLLLARRGSGGTDTRGLGGRLAPGLLRYFLPLLHFPRALRWAGKFRPNIVYDRFSSYGLGVLLAKTLHVPVVGMVLDGGATRITLGGSDRLITTEPSLVPKKYRHKVIQVQWGANTELFHPGVNGAGVRKSLGISQDSIVIGYTGAFYPWHGLETLVAAAAHMQGSHGLEKFRFLLVGDGKVRPAIEKQVESRGLGRFFIFTGRVDYEDVPQYIAACDMCLAPYNPSQHPEMAKKELFFDPLKVFEYLAMGKATIGPEGGNMRRMFTDRKHLLLVPPARPELLAHMCLLLAADPELRRQLGREGRRIIEASFSWAAHVRQLNAIFVELKGAAAGGRLS